METIETTASLLTNENYKSQLDSRLQTAFEERISSLEQKVQTDIYTTLEGLKYEYYETLKKFLSYTHFEESPEKHNHQNSNDELNNTFTTTKEEMNTSSITHKTERKIQIKRLDDGKSKDLILAKELKSQTEVKDRSRTPIRTNNNQISNKNTASTKDIKKATKDTKESKEVKDVKDVKDIKPHLQERSKTPVREKPLTPTIPKKIKHVENNLNKSALIESTKALDKTIDIEKKEEKKQTKRVSVLSQTGGEKRSSLYQSTQSSLLKIQPPRDKDSAPNGTGNYLTERDTKRKSSVIVEKRNSLLNSVDKIDKSTRKSSVVAKGSILNNTDYQNQTRKSQVEHKVVRRDTKKENKDTSPKNDAEKSEKLANDNIIIKKKSQSQQLENSEKSNEDKSIIEENANIDNDLNEKIDLSNDINKVVIPLPETNDKETISTSSQEVKLDANSDSTSPPLQSQISKKIYEGKKLPGDLESCDKMTKALYLVSNSEIMELKNRYLIATCIPKIKENFNFKNLISHKIFLIEQSLNKLEADYAKYFDDPTVSYLISKMFNPSKTAQNGLTFVTKEEEANLCKKEQPEEILNVFRIIYIIINEDYESIQPNKLIDNLINVVLTKIKVENMNAQYNKLHEIIRANPKVLSSPDFIKINRCVSYMTFIIKEAWEYFSLRASDGVMVYNLRKVNNEKQILKEKLANLQNLLK